MTTAADLPALAADAGTKFLLTLFVDLRGEPCANHVPVEAVEVLATEGVGFPATPSALSASNLKTLT